jgi:hypothetical protein
MEGRCIGDLVLGMPPSLRLKPLNIQVDWLTYSSQNYGITLNKTIIEFSPNDAIALAHSPGSGKASDTVVTEQPSLKAQHLEIFLFTRQQGLFGIPNATVTPKEMNF